MLIVLNDADFSSLNVGKTTIPVELSDLTKQVLSKLTGPLTEPQKFAVNNFLNTLQNYDIWDSIGTFYMPLIAANKTEAFYDIKRDVYIDADSKTHWGFSIKNGLYATNQWDDSQYLRAPEIVEVTAANYLISVSSRNVLTNSYSLLSGGVNNGRQVMRANTSIWITNNANFLTIDSNVMYGKNWTISGKSLTDINEHNCYVDSLAQINKTGNGAINNFGLTYAPIFDKTVISNDTVAIIIIGTYIDNEKLSILNNAQMRLIDAFQD